MYLMLRGSYFVEDVKIIPMLIFFKGVGLSKVRVLQGKIGFPTKYNFIYLEKWQQRLLRRTVTKSLLGWHLSKYVMSCIKMQILIGSYKGLRHKQLLPVRGQRTHTNRKTQRMLSYNRWKKEPEKL